jgi:hypothetical protein
MIIEIEILVKRMWAIIEEITFFVKFLCEYQVLQWKKLDNMLEDTWNFHTDLLSAVNRLNFYSDFNN